MNFFKDPKYSSIRVILLLIIIVGAGWFVVSNMNQSNSNQGLVINRVPTPVVNPTPIPAVSIERGVKVTLEQNPGGACKTGQACTIVVGAEGDAVKAYQLVLQKAGYLSATATLDGSYDSQTKAGVLAFQKASNIPQTGNIDPATQIALASLLQPKQNQFPVVSGVSCNTSSYGSSCLYCDVGDNTGYHTYCLGSDNIYHLYVW